MENRNLIIYKELGDIDFYNLKSLLNVLKTNNQLNNILQRRLFFNLIRGFEEEVFDVIGSIKPQESSLNEKKIYKNKSRKKRKKIKEKNNCIKRENKNLFMELDFGCKDGHKKLLRHINKLINFSKTNGKKISINIKINNVDFVINIENGLIKENEKKIIYLLFDSNTRIKGNLGREDADKFYEKIKNEIQNNQKSPIKISPYSFMADKECSYDYLKNKNDQKKIDLIYRKKAFELVDPITDKKLVKMFFNLSINYFDKINKIIRLNFDKYGNKEKTLILIKKEILKQNLSSEENIENVFNDKFLLKLINEYKKYEEKNIQKKIGFVDFRIVLGSFIRNIFTYDKSVIISRDEDLLVIGKIICNEIIPRFLAERILDIEKENANKLNQKSREYLSLKFNKNGYNTDKYKRDVISELRKIVRESYNTDQDDFMKKNALFIINMEKENSRFLSINLDQNILDICVIGNQNLQTLTDEIKENIKKNLEY